MHLNSETDMLRKLQHKNISRLHEVFKTDNHYYVILDKVI